MVSRPITERMHHLIKHWEREEDNRRVFLTCYTMMTENMLKGIDEDTFEDGRWVNDLLHRFAAYYFHGLETFEDESTETPAVWQIAHQTAADQKIHVMKHLLLGINAHINYDLVLTMVDMLEPEWQYLPQPALASRYRDYCHVNDIIAGTIDEVQDTVVESINPAMAVLDTLGGRLDEWVVSRLINNWREEVWGDALRLLAAVPPEEREKLRTEVEARTLRFTRRILSLP